MHDLFSTLVTGERLDDKRATAGRLLFESLGIADKHPTGGHLRDHFQRKKESQYANRDGILVRTWPETDFDTASYLEAAAGAAEFICVGQSPEVRLAFEKSLTQIMGNAVQHSGVGRGKFAAIRTDYYASFVVLDYGVGIAKTFCKVLNTLDGEPTEERKAEIALRWAMMECISSGDETSPNRGRGLPLLKEACSSALVVSDGSYRYSSKGTSFFPFEYGKSVKERGASGQIQKSNLEPLSQFGVIVEAYIDLHKIEHAMSGSSVDCSAVRKAIANEFGEDTAAKLFREK